MKYGIRDNKLLEPPETMFTVSKKLGLDGMEFCVNDSKDNLLWEEGGADRLKTLADTDGMEIASLSPGIFGRLSPVNPDAEKRAQGHEALTYLIELCPILETSLILIPIRMDDFDEWTEEKWRMVLDGFKPLVEVAEKHNVVLAMETGIRADQVLMLIDRVGSQYLKSYYDVANAAGRGYDVPAEIRQLGHQIGMIHMKDTDQKMLGEGNVDFKGVSDAMRDIGYDGYLILETPPGDDPKANAAKNLTFIKKLGK